MVVNREAVLGALRVAYPHALGLAGLGAVAWGLAGWFGWPAGLIAAGLPFFVFYCWGQALEVRGAPRQES